MTAPRAHARLLAALLTLTMFTACGDDDDSGSSDASGDTSESDAGSSDDSGTDDTTETDDSSDSTDASSEDDDTGGGGGGVPADVADAEYSQGEAHVEVSGDEDITVDLPTGGGFSDGGIVSLSFGQGGDVLGIALDGGGGGGVSFSTSDFGSGGTFPDQCSLDFSENSESVLAGTFECEGVGAVAGSSTDLLTVDIRGSFELHA